MSSSCLYSKLPCFPWSSKTFYKQTVKLPVVDLSYHMQMSRVTLSSVPRTQGTKEYDMSAEL
jgi:hypothetical protein